MKNIEKQNNINEIQN